MSEHTKEPWGAMDVRPGGVERITIIGEEGQVICRVENMVSGRSINAEDEANARRIVACVNVCAGIDTNTLETAAADKKRWGRMFEKSIVDIATHAELEQQRDELLVALKSARAVHVRRSWDEAALAEMDAVIDKTEAACR